MDVGLVEGLVVVLPMWALSAAVLYWIIRLAVRHGTLDAYRIDRADRRIADMKVGGVSETIRRQQAAYDSDPE